MKINRPDIENSYQAVQLGAIRERYERIGRDIDGVINVESFKGKTANAIRAYFREVHAMATKSFIILIMETESGMRSLLNNLRDVDASDDAILNANFLEHIHGVTKDNM